MTEDRAPYDATAPRSLSDVLIDAFAALDRLDASAQGAVNLSMFGLFQQDADAIAETIDHVAPVRIIVACHPQANDLAAIRRALELMQPVDNDCPVCRHGFWKSTGICPDCSTADVVPIADPPICPKCGGDGGQAHDFGGGTAWEPCPNCQPNHLSTAELDKLADVFPNPAPTDADHTHTLRIRGFGSPGPEDDTLTDADLNPDVLYPFRKEWDAAEYFNRHITQPLDE